ncbi:hypothetical protein [Nocardioides sp. LHG3406-4]|uniref:hypothetical protein n=1 Tax=Nocardioides sp. LHG3406-4 TaxID=2804575 RepID=UPI003CF4B6FB
MKHALLVASLVLIGGSAVACGGGGDSDGGDAPTSASKTEFCDAYQGLFTDLAGLAGDTGEAPDENAMLNAIQDWAADMEKVGTPEGISDDVRSGFELTVGQAKDLEADDLKEANLEDLTTDLSEDEQKQAQAFTTYVTDSCGNPLDEIMPSEPAS